jgi:hypothetical protein
LPINLVAPALGDHGRGHDPLTGLQSRREAAGDTKTHNAATTPGDGSIKRRGRTPSVAHNRNPPSDLGLEGEAGDRYD